MESGYYAGTGVGGTSYDGGPYHEPWYPGIQWVLRAERERCQSECVSVDPEHHRTRWRISARSHQRIDDV